MLLPCGMWRAARGGWRGKPFSFFFSFSLFRAASLPRSNVPAGAHSRADVMPHSGRLELSTKWPKRAPGNQC